MKKLNLILFVLLTPVVSFSQLMPNEWVEIEFTDATNAKDTIVLGLYTDSVWMNTVGYYPQPEFESMFSIATMGLDTAFGEINSFPDTSSFSVRSVIDTSGNDDFIYLKKDIRFGDSQCMYYLFDASRPFAINAWHAQFPIKTKTSIHHYSANGSNPNPESGCFMFACGGDYSVFIRVFESFDGLSISGGDTCIGSYSDIDSLYSFNDPNSGYASNYFENNIYWILAYKAATSIAVNTASVFSIIDAGNNIFKIDNPNDMNLNVNVIDLSGRAVFHDNCKETSLLIDLQEMKPGLYLIYCYDNNGSEFLSSRKVIVN
ncbi:MAG: T9SS type A sorting domain-containing protein [Bacteroidales bacterium]